MSRLKMPMHLQELRLSRKVSVTTMAKRLGCTVAELRELEGGPMKLSDFMTVQRYLEALGYMMEVYTSPIPNGAKDADSRRRSRRQKLWLE